MRLRLAVPAASLAALAMAIAPGAAGTAGAAPRHNHGLTINATPDPIVSGEAVLIYGQLNTSHPAHKLISLYHRVNPAGTFTLEQTTFTNASGFYKLFVPAASR